MHTSIEGSIWLLDSSDRLSLATKALCMLHHFTIEWYFDLSSNLQAKFFLGMQCVFMVIKVKYINKNKISIGLHLGNDLRGRRKYRKYVKIHVYLRGMGRHPPGSFCTLNSGSGTFSGT